MDHFIDEMRTQFQATSTGNAIPQSLLFQQTRLMEKQVQVLESNQKSMNDVINNVLNANATGPGSQANMRQQIFHENRTMLLQMMAPMAQQLNEMKVLYENSKATSSDVGAKIDELKKVLAMQGDMYMRPQGGSMYGGSMNNNMDMMDPNIVKKGIEDIKEQMREMQKEAYMIENNMEKRYQAISQKNQQQRYLPQSLTEEFDTFQQQIREKTLHDQIQMPSGINHTRQVITEKLGGPFDYTQFSEDLRGIMVEKEILDR